MKNIINIIIQPNDKADKKPRVLEINPRMKTVDVDGFLRTCKYHDSETLKYIIRIVQSKDTQMKGKGK